MSGQDDDGDDAGDDGILGVDELHIVFSEFKSMLSQSAEARRIAPMVVEYVEDAPDDGPHTLFSFEPTRNRCSTRCCRGTSPPASTRRCSRPQRPNLLRAAGR